jgi:hypothetical protein
VVQSPLRYRRRDAQRCAHRTAPHTGCQTYLGCLYQLPGTDRVGLVATDKTGLVLSLAGLRVLRVGGV